MAGAIGLNLALAGWASTACAEDFAAGPEWLRAPIARGPVAATFGVDERHAWWGVDGTVPLGLGLPRTRANVAGQRVLGLGMSITGSARSDVQDLRYTALIDRRSRIDGTWLGISTGQNAKLQLGTGLWRAFDRVEVEAGLESAAFVLGCSPSGERDDREVGQARVLPQLHGDFVAAHPRQADVQNH